MVNNREFRSSTRKTRPNFSIMQAYLDHNASAPLLDEAKSAMIATMEMDGNPSSVHGNGRALRKVIENSRALVAQSAGISPVQVIFTSGATEAAQHALGRQIRNGNSRHTLSHLYISSIEHPCVLAGGRFGHDQVTKIAVHENGVVDLDELHNVLTHHDHTQGAPMVAVMLANNETGVIQPIAEVSKIVREHGGYLCVDAVQAYGKCDIDLGSLGAHFILVSGHKIGGPKGVGALLMMDSDIAPQRLIRGGGQENLNRGGTENAAAIAGFGAAVENFMNNRQAAKTIASMRQRIERNLEEISRQSSNNTPLPQFFGVNAQRLDNTTCFAVEGIKAETALIALDLAGIAVSSGSACAAGRVNQSHVLAAMGVDPELAECTLRVSIGHQTTDDEARYFTDTWKTIVEKRA